MIEVNIPGRSPFILKSLLSDLNGTLSRDGKLVPGVAERLVLLSKHLKLHLVTSDTLGTADALFADLPVALHRTSGKNCSFEKVEVLNELGASTTVALGNGSNDCAMLREAVLGICIFGPEGAATETMQSSDMVVVDPLRAIDALLRLDLLRSTLRR